MQSTLLLLVEDEDAVRTILEETLREGGFDLKIAGNGADALAIWKATVRLSVV
jgi:CheY-like chemotaxis protein